MRRKRSLFFSDEPAESTALNLTPLIDVVFVVLILFILISPMLEMDRLQLARAPHHSQSEKEFSNPSHPLTIHVYADNSIYVNKTLVLSENLPTLLKTLYLKNKQFTPQLYQDRSAFFGTYQMVKNALEEAGFEELNIILDPSR